MQKGGVDGLGQGKREGMNLSWVLLLVDIGMSQRVSTRTFPRAQVAIIIFKNQLDGSILQYLRTTLINLLRAFGLSLWDEIGLSGSILHIQGI